MTVDRWSWPLPAASARVRLRPLRTGDLVDFHGYRSDPDVGRYQGWRPMSVDEATAFIQSMQDIRGPVPGAWIQLGIAETGGDRLIGDVGLHTSADGTTAEIGISCAPAFQGRGMATDAVTLLLGLVFANPACTVVRGVVDARNRPSIRLLQRLGFEAGDAVETVFRGEPCVEITYTKARDGSRP